MPSAPADSVRPVDERRAVGGPDDAGWSDDLRPESPRVVLLLSAFDPSTGASEVSLAWRGLRAIGRATGSPMTGAAQATLSAVAALGADVPYHVTSVERTTMHDGLPGGGVTGGRRGDDISDIERRLGVAGGLDESEAASRATLSALNRLLARAPTGR